MDRIIKGVNVQTEENLKEIETKVSLWILNWPRTLGISTISGVLSLWASATMHGL